MRTAVFQIAPASSKWSPSSSRSQPRDCSEFPPKMIYIEVSAPKHKKETRKYIYISSSDFLPLRSTHWARQKIGKQRSLRTESEAGIGVHAGRFKGWELRKLSPSAWFLDSCQRSSRQRDSHRGDSWQCVNSCLRNSQERDTCQQDSWKRDSCQRNSYQRDSCPDDSWQWEILVNASLLSIILVNMILAQ